MTLLEQLLGSPLPPEGGQLVLRGRPYVMRDGILRAEASHSETQSQASDTYAFLWSKLEFARDNQAFQEAWFEESFPGLRAELPTLVPPGSLMLDAGCGAGWSALAFFGEHLGRMRYVGADISSAVELARRNLKERGLTGELLQASLTQLPFAPGTFDFVFTPGVLHHTDSVQESLSTLAELLRPGGALLLWVYRKAPPLREHADSLIRRHLAPLADDDSYRELLPLARLGQSLGHLNVEIDVPEDIPYLGIPKGRMPLQRFFHYYVCKTFYQEGMSLERANFHNFDWYRPTNAHTSTPEEVEAYCRAAGLAVEWSHVTRGGISIVARRTAPPH